MNSHSSIAISAAQIS